ncbi:hypothetical protein ACT17_31540 [Mycolicibacterium conceptionense]|jgi:hypothetical protein|uniref:Uncharacterized protein n=3 Tax=Mycolicibacterium TaxID=1866885 RepID=A0ABR5G1J1_9MYCO|nr:hypothetical protein AA982_30360 [Mycolicibacterium senegalense]KLO54004.1 hypothetical protein ABW05_23555 [Mycolicibacterium senegalense]KMV14177.1 hypothetical protein ACT17_31540 [Mycolicibacterium conceptionense]OMB94061.1 hypothetical protein A5746_18465 [Mycolicibacterium conceptionense]
MTMAVSRESLNKVKRMAAAFAAAGAMAVVGVLGSAVANAEPVSKVGSDPVAPASPGGSKAGANTAGANTAGGNKAGGSKAPFSKVGSDPISSAVSGIVDAATSAGSGVEIPPLVSPWPGGAWAGHDWSKGYPGGGFANGKGGGAAIHGKAGGAWAHRD